MIDRLKNTSLFFIPYLCLFGLSMIFYFYQSHGDFVLWLGGLHNPVWDFFFKYWTYTGSTGFFVVIAVLLLVIKRRFGLVLSMVGITILVADKFFKQMLFPGTPRPSVYFEKELLNLVDGVEMLSTSSFPSGHSMGAFGLATFLALMLQSNNLSLLLLVGATLTALSRIYLAQHFLIDTMAGSLCGIILATSFYMIFEKYLNKELASEKKTPDEDLAEMDLKD
ncbi:MAG: phosphatase PAP2 family protein [Ekhidna sp.]|uniref:phosphatase PAP2 family protein n=1 Tax=Ekhidna sp. TaxID=2608089 RepID=UPI0032EFE37C